MTRKIISALLALCVLVSLALPAAAAEKSEIAPYAQRLIQYYRHYQDAAEDNIWDILQQMKEIDPDQAAVWEGIMGDWSWIHSEMPVYEKVLPDGLPEDDSLCIVVMGYGLNEDGTMKEELIDRLVVALASALKYPNALVAVTGGETSSVEGVTEAGQMAVWLQQKGLDTSRVIMEAQSLSTTANAVNVYKLLNSSYPQVDSIALVTSDYHLAWSCTMFTAVSRYKSGYEGGRYLELVGSAVSTTGQSVDTLNSEAWGISLVAGLTYDENAAAPELYAVDRPAEPEIELTEAPEATDQTVASAPAAVQEETEEEETTAAFPWKLLLVLLIAAAAYVLTPKKPKKKNRRQRPKLDLDV